LDWEGFTAAAAAGADISTSDDDSVLQHTKMAKKRQVS
jgi:hypothetical protein